MADARALLKAKRLEARIAHPFATYTPSDQLKCVVCGTLIKHGSAWEGHLGSKIHRKNVTRSKEEKTLETWEKAEEKEQILPGKRKAETSEFRQSDKKRRMSVTEGRSTHVHGLPAGFFSDPSRVLMIPEFPSDESDDDANDKIPAKTTNSESRSLQAPSTSVLDMEYDLFQRGFLGGMDHSQSYDKATITAEPALVSQLVPDSIDVATVVLTPDEGDKNTRDHEERELIIDRLLEEERAQEDADMRVHLMKNKLEGLKRRREALKALKVQVSDR